MSHEESTVPKVYSVIWTEDGTRNGDTLCIRHALEKVAEIDPVSDILTLSTISASVCSVCGVDSTI